MPVQRNIWIYLDKLGTVCNFEKTTACKANWSTLSVEITSASWFDFQNKGMEQICSFLGQKKIWKEGTNQFHWMARLQFSKNCFLIEIHHTQLQLSLHHMTQNIWLKLWSYWSRQEIIILGFSEGWAEYRRWVWKFASFVHWQAKQIPIWVRIQSWHIQCMSSWGLSFLLKSLKSLLRSLDFNSDFIGH